MIELLSTRAARANTRASDASAELLLIAVNLIRTDAAQRATSETIAPVSKLAGAIARFCSSCRAGQRQCLGGTARVIRQVPVWRDTQVPVWRDTGWVAPKPLDEKLEPSG